MTLKNDFNVWSKWDPLKKVMVGHCVAPEYFDHVANIEIKEKLQQLVIEAQEDLDYIAKVCGEQGVEVVRVNKEKFPKYLDPDQKAQGIQPVLYPRNRLAVLGQHLIFSDQHATSDGYFSEIITEDILQRNTPWHDLLIKNNIKCIGVDPAKNVIKKIKDKKITTYNLPFNFKLAKKIKTRFNDVDLIVSSFSFGHINDMKSVSKGIDLLLNKNSVIHQAKNYPRKFYLQNHEYQPSLT